MAQLPDGAEVYVYVGQDPDGMHRLHLEGDPNEVFRIDSLPADTTLPGDRFGIDEDSIYALA